MNILINNRRYLIVIFASFFFLINIVYAQENLIHYKERADILLLSLNKKKILKRAKCEEFIVVGRVVGSGYGGKYSENKNMIITKDAEYVLIYYSLFSKQLDHTFYFHVVVDSNRIATLPNGGLNDIPLCVINRNKCNFIRKEQAIKIAKSDRIKNADNLKVEFKLLKSMESKDYYWVVSSQDRNIIDYNLPEPEGGWRYFPLKEDNTRYINAITGHLKSYKEVQSDD